MQLSNLNGPRSISDDFPEIYHLLWYFTYAQLYHWDAVIQTCMHVRPARSKLAKVDLVPCASCLATRCFFLNALQPGRNTNPRFIVEALQQEPLACYGTRESTSTSLQVVAFLRHTSSVARYYSFRIHLPDREDNLVP